MQFQTLKIAATSPGYGRLMSNSQTRCPLPLAKSLPSLIGITRIYFLEKTKKNVISDPSNGRNFSRSRSFEVRFADKVALTLAMFLPCLVGITKANLEKSAKM